MLVPIAPTRRCAPATLAPVPPPAGDPHLEPWFHRHSDHPYPSEEEKRQLCHAIGLSMSRVFNWMTNVSPPLAPVSGPTHAPARHSAGSWRGLPHSPRIPQQHTPRRPCPRCWSPGSPPQSRKSRPSRCPPPIITPIPLGVMLP